MRRRIAAHLLAAAALVTLLVARAAHEWVAPVCLFWVVVSGVPLGPRRVHLPGTAVSILQILLVVLFMGLMLRHGIDFLAVLLSMASLLLNLRLLAEESVFNDFLVVLLSLLILVGSAAVCRGWTPLWITALFVGVACLTVPVIVARPARNEEEVSVRLNGRMGVWRFATAASAGVLAAVALAAGFFLYLIAPRLSSESGLMDRSASADTELLTAKRRSGGAAAGSASKGAPPLIV